MKRMLLALCVLIFCTLFAAPSLCRAQEVYGVITEDRVVNLPQDQNKWYISVVGQDGSEKYQTLIGWFDTDVNLKKLKDQVHFCPITTTSQFYAERYEKNIKGLPTVRVQTSTGSVVYEASGVKIPYTAAGLYAAIADGVTQSPRKYLLPYRNNRDKATPSPDPDGKPVDPPAAPLDNEGAPDLDEAPVTPDETLPPFALMFGTLMIAAGIGFLMELHRIAKAKTS